jgi:hypothetical protein
LDISDRCVAGILEVDVGAAERVSQDEIGVGIEVDASEPDVAEL